MAYQQIPLPIVYQGAVPVAAEDFLIGPGRAIPAPVEIPPVDYIGWVADTMDWPWPTFKSWFA